MNKNGFTMIELVVAVAIMGIIMIIAIPSVNYIQNDNKDTKYRAYAKSIDAASKLYIDNYSEDIIGSKNSGCGVIRYEDLKEKDLIEDIQLKNTNCGNDATGNKNYTYIKVRKSKNGNYGYESNVTCRDSKGNILFGKPTEGKLEEDCKLEDGETPSVTIFDTGSYKSQFEKGTYYYNQPLKLRVTIKDSGVGLKENQELSYKWYTVSGDKRTQISPSGTIYFKNKNYEGSKTKDIPMPSNMEKASVTTNYLLEIKGDIEDVDNNKNEYRNEKNIQIFLGRVFIKLNANGGTLAPKHLSTVTLNSSNNVEYNKSERTSSIWYNNIMDTDGIWNYNNPGWLNLTRTGYHVDSKKEWIGTVYGKDTVFDQSIRYKASDFADVYKENKDVTLKVNWKPNTYTVSFDCNGGSGAPSSQTGTYGSAFTLTSNVCTKKGYTQNGWVDQNGTVWTTSNTNKWKWTYTYNPTLKARWTAKTYTVSFNCNGGSGAPKAQTGTYNSKFTLTSSTCSRSGYYQNGWKDQNGTRWTTGNTNNWTWSYDYSVTLKAQWEPSCSLSNPHGCNTMYVCDNAQANPFEDGYYGEVFLRNTCDVNSTTNTVGKVYFRDDIYILGYSSPCYSVAVDTNNNGVYEHYYIKGACLKDQSYNYRQYLGGSGRFGNSLDPYGSGRCDYACKH